MHADLVWFELDFPRDIAPASVEAVLRGMHGLSTPGRSADCAFQIEAVRGKITHRVGMPARRVAACTAQLTTHLPGLTLTETTSPAAPANATSQLGARLCLSSSRRPLRTEDPELVSRGLLAALDGLAQGEQVTLTWLLGPGRRSVVVPVTHSPQVSESWPRALVSAAVVPPKEVDSEARRALRAKQGEAGWRAVGRIGIASGSTARSRGLLGQVLGALRAAEGPGASLGTRPLVVRRLSPERLPWVWNLALSVDELVALVGWPLGEAVTSAVQQRRSRLLPIPRGLPRQGRIVAVSPTGDRPLALSTADSLQHSIFLGPTGTGKSTLILGLATSDMLAGRSICVVDPKSDLVDEILKRVPPERYGDIVLIDPADDSPIGLNPLRGSDPHLVADQVLAIVAKLNADSWGPRLSELLHAALLTLALTPDMHLAALPLLLTHDSFRRRIVGALDDPLGVGPVWAWYDRLSEEAQSQARAAVLNKIRPLVGRPALRGVLGQAQPSFDLRELFTSRKIVLVRLDRGRLGPEATRLLGTLFVRQLWEATLTRTRIVSEKRHPVMVYLDELADFAALPADLSEILSKSRGLGVGYHLAAQFLDQLTPQLREAVLSQARSRVLFQLSYSDAASLARGHRELTPEDLTELPAREVYLRLVHGSAVTPYMSGKTLPPPPVTSDLDKIRHLSRDRYGIPRTVTDAKIRALLDDPRSTGGSAIGVRRRPS